MQVALVILLVREVHDLTAGVRRSEFAIHQPVRERHGAQSIAHGRSQASGGQVALDQEPFVAHGRPRARMDVTKHGIDGLGRFDLDRERARAIAASTSRVLSASPAARGLRQIPSGPWVWPSSAWADVQLASRLRAISSSSFRRSSRNPATAFTRARATELADAA